MVKRKPRKPQIPNARAIFARAKRVAEDVLVEGLEDWGDEIRDEFVERIEEQSFASFQEILYPESGTNLSPSWLDRKEAAGADLRTMIATGHYIDSIRVFKRHDRKEKKWVIRIGFHHSAKPRDLEGRTVDIEIPGTGIKGLTALAIVHELGSIKANVPARPHWGPHRALVRKDARKKRRELRREISEALRGDAKLKELAVGRR
jgi:hypothetical protein